MLTPPFATMGAPKLARRERHFVDFRSSRAGSQSRFRPSGPVCLATDALYFDALTVENSPQGEHAGGRLVDRARERDRPLQHRGQLPGILDACIRVLVLDDEVHAGYAVPELEELARGELVIQPVDRAV